jgi:hypothetical protein
MMNMAETIIREAVRNELMPLFRDCGQIGVEIERAESTLPEIFDRHERAAASVDLILRRANICKLQSTEESGGDKQLQASR